MVATSELDEIRALLRQTMPTLFERYGVSSLGLFGSRVRHENRHDSDLDILVTFSETPSLLRFIELENYLSDLLQKRIDLVMRNSLKTSVGERILEEVVPI
jgi:hypothetical protein